MSRYKDYREPRRRGFDDDFSPKSRRGSDDMPSFRQGGQPAAYATAAPQGATVKWFNADKGFGFVEVDGGAEAFLHIRPVEAAGHTSLPDGARLTVRIGQGQKGPQVTEVVDVDLTTATPRPARPARAPGAGGFGGGSAGGDDREFSSASLSEEQEGVVKWYNPDKGFGFIALDSGGKDVFVHATALERSGLTRVAEGQRVVVQVAQGQKGVEARTIREAD